MKGWHEPQRDKARTNTSRNSRSPARHPHVGGENLSGSLPRLGVGHGPRLAKNRNGQLGAGSVLRGPLGGSDGALAGLMEGQDGMRWAETGFRDV